MKPPANIQKKKKNQNKTSIQQMSDFSGQREKKH